ncbi:MAG TPA: DUF1684 domain-containing protein [Gemmatimonadales bacterium]|nr:DUF1684 domain-containing protein [Gemmatimonadales bacterium]
MPVPADPLSLADWRRRVTELYAEVRAAPAGCEPQACERFRRRRDQLFATHPQAPLEPGDRSRFTGLAYYAYNMAWRVTGRLEPAQPVERHHITLSGDGLVTFTSVATVRFTCPAGPGQLSLYWIEGYGGGLFLPFRDASAGQGTYAGGRYLWDTIKGAGLALREDQILLDFNYAYNPSCAYSNRWVCPLAPAQNHLPFAVPVGETVPSVRS